MSDTHTDDPSRRRVHVLPPELADKIAAGEVIQRPESVVKELVENSLDAGATRIQVVLEKGGMDLIRVADDGAGMDEQDAVASFLRHATSKILSYDDLERIRTYGFRGEALASVAAVAHVTMSTRRADDDAAVLVTIDGEGPPAVSREGRTPGTTMTVRRLFHRVPARRKFLKSAATELRHCTEAVIRAALSRPDVAVSLRSDGDVVFDLRAGTLRERIRGLFGESTLDGLAPVEERMPEVTVSGFVSTPQFGRKTRAHQYLFLNRRFIIHRGIAHAVASAYEHLLAPGMYPFFVLFFELDPERVDVNVHPSKLEAKFEDDQAMYRFTASVVRRTLAGGGFVPGVGMTGSAADGDGVGLRFLPDAHGPAGMFTPPLREDDRLFSREGFLAGVPAAGGADLAARLLQPASGEIGRPSGSPGAPVWQLHRKYLFVPVEGGVLVVDQHVAHERILYERAKARLEGKAQPSQQLLFARTLELSAAEAGLLGEIMDEVSRLGFTVRMFSGGTVMVEGIPADVRSGAEADLLREVLDEYREEQRSAGPDVRDALAKSFACRAAIKAGDPLNETEQRSLLDQLFATSMPYVCPHGRPVVFRLSLQELDRRFGRT